MSLLKKLFKEKKQNLPGSLREEYIGWVISYCDEYARFCDLSAKIEAGEVIEKSEAESLKEILRRLSYASDHLLAAKAAYGIHDKLLFMENNNFKGFSIKEGRLVGDCTEAYAIASPWLYSYMNGESDNHYTFEVANLIISLANNTMAEAAA